MRRMARWLCWLAAAGVAVHAAGTKGLPVAMGDGPVKSPAAGLAASGGVAANQVLANGVATTFNLPAQTVNPDTWVLYNQASNNGFLIQVPAGATRLDIQVVINTAGVDVDLFVRGANDVVLAGDRIAAEYASAGTTQAEHVTFVPCPGTYFIALAIYNGATTAQSLAATGVITATYDSAPFSTGQALASGTPRNLTYTAVSDPTLFNGAGSFRVDVPAGATRLTVTLETTTPAGDLDLYVRYGCDVTAPGGQVAADYRSEAESATDQVEARPDTSPPLRAGTYYIAVVVYNIGVATNGTLTATVGTGAAAAPAISTAAALSFGSVAVGNQSDAPLTIRNTGTATLTVTSLTSSNTTEFSVVPPPSTPFTIAAGGQQNVTVRFRPSATGARTGNLTIASNDPGRPSTVVALSGAGTGTGAQISASSASLNFTTQPGVNPAPQTFTVRNSGSGTLNFRVTSNQTWLSVSPATGSSTVQTVTLTASVNVAGLAAGQYNGELRITESTGVGAQDPGAEQAAPVVIAVRLTIQASTGPCPGGPAGAPLITAGGVVNAASFVNAVLPGGAIARGALFSLFGQAVGPSQLVTAARFPLERELGCVSVRVTLGNSSVDAFPLAVTATQINAVMPSNAPLGEATITVTYNGRTSNAQRVRIVEASFGFFTANQSGAGPVVAQNYESQGSLPVHSPRRPLRRGQRGIAYGTGLGGISAPDNQPAPAGEPRVTVELTIGGKPAVAEYAGRTPGFAGLDQINFVVPDDAPLGCYVPIQLKVGALVSNTVTAAISASATECSDPANPYSRILTRGGKVGSIQLVRLNARLQLDPTTNFTNLDVDVGTAIFSEAAAAGEFDYNPIAALPPPGSCTVFSAGGIDLSGLLAGQLPGNAPTGKILNAGAALAVSGPGGVKAIPRSTDLSGLYFGVLGGAIPLLGPPPQPLYLSAGEYTVTGPGGPDVGAFTARFQVPAAFNWTNRDSLAQSTRANGVTVAWSGGDPATQGVTILGGNLDNASGVGAAFVCFADFAAGSFTVPPAITLALPPSNLQQPDQTLGFLAAGVFPKDFPTFTAPGLDAGWAYFAQFGVVSVVWR